MIHNLSELRKQGIPFGGSFFIAVAFAIFFSSFTLILVESWIKYPLFLFEVATILVILVALRRDPLTEWKRNIRFGAESEKILDVIFIGSSSILLVFAFLGIENGLLRLILALVTASFLSGNSILNISGIAKYFSALEKYVLAFIVSFTFCAVLTLTLMGIGEDTRAVIMSSVFLLLGLLSLRKHKKTIGYSYHQRSLSRSIDIIPILLAIAFYVVFFVIIYPDAALLPTSDVSRHINDSLVLSRSPELYTGNLYMFFHAFEGGYYVLSGLNQPVYVILSSLAFLNVFLPLSIYTLAKRFLSDIDQRIPALSLLLYCFASGLSFIYYTELNLISYGGDRPEYGVIAQAVAEKSYFGIINFLQPFHFFVPISVSIITFSMVLLLLRNFSIPRITFIFIFGSLLISMYFVHVVEPVVFVLFLSVYSFFFKSKKLRIFDALISSLIAFSVISLFLIIAPFIFSSELKIGNPRDNLLFLIKIAPLFLVSGCLLWRWKAIPRLNMNYTKFQIYKKLHQILSYTLIIAYLVGIILWVFMEELKTSPFYFEIGAVPWFLYPVMLGIVGLLALLGIKMLTSQDLKHDGIILLVVAIGFSFFLGKLVTYINANFIDVAYWEKRFLMLIFLFSSLLAPIPLIRLSDHLNIKKHKTITGIVLPGVVSSIIICGFSSMAIQSEYWYSTTHGPNRISDFELQALDYLKDALHNDKRAFTAAPTDFSRHILAFAAPPYHLSKPDLLFHSRYPEVSLLSLNVKNLDHAYIYLHDRDIENLRKNSDSWFTSHLLPMLPLVFSNEVVRIYNASSAVIPQDVSDSVFLIPRNPHSTSWLYTYNILYQSGQNYSELHELDPNIISAKNLVIPFDPTANFVFHDNFSTDKNTTNRWDEISGDWKFTPDGLRGKAYSTDVFNDKSIILSPAYSGDGTTSLLFKINNADPNRFSHVSILTSWRDTKNHDFAGLAVRNNQIHSYFAEVVGGKVSFAPDFPFLDTGLEWTPGSTLNLTISASNKSQELFINGTKYLQSTDDVEAGRTGLIFSRVSDVLFDDFKVLHNHSSAYTSTKNLFEFVKNGGALFVINTEGHGDIAEFLRDVNTSINFTEAIRPQINKNLELEKLNWSRSSSPKENLDALMDTQNFFALKGTMGKGNLIYVNLYPLISKLNSGELPPSIVYPIFGNISQIFDFPKLTFDKPSANVREIPAFFKEMVATGKIRVVSNSVIFPENSTENHVEIFYDGQNKTEFKNSTVSIDYSTKNISVYANDVNIANGKGFYTNLFIKKGPVILTFDNNSSVSITSNNGSKYIFPKVSDLILSGSDHFNLLAKQPSVTVNGNVVFQGFEGGNFLYPKLGTVNRMKDISFIGQLNSSIFMSDRTSVLDKVSVDGTFNNTETEKAYNELSLLLTSKFDFNLYDLPPLVRGLLLIPFVLSIVFLFYKKIF